MTWSNQAKMYLFFTVMLVVVAAALITAFNVGASTKSTSGTQGATTVTGTGGSGVGYSVSHSQIQNQPNIGSVQQAQIDSVSVLKPDPTKPISNGKYQLTLVGSQTINRYTQYPSPAVTVTGTATSSASVASAFGNGAGSTGYLYPGITDLFTAGDNSAQFFNYTYANPLISTGAAVPIISQAYSAPSLYFANVSNPTTVTQKSQSNGYASVIAPILAGSTAPVNLYQGIQAGTNFGCVPNCLYVLTVNAPAWGSIYVNGQAPISPNSGYSAPSLTSGNALSKNLQYVGSQTQSYAWIINGSNLVNTAWSTGLYPGQGASTTGTNQYFFNIQATPTTAIAMNEIISSALIPMTQYFNATNGTPNNCGGQGCAWNPQTHAAFGFGSIVASNSFIVQVN